MLSSAQLTRVVAVLERAGGLDALWVFGSEATGRTRAGSDVDLAALFASRPTTEAILRARDELAELLGRPVDLVDLDRASPVLAMQVLRHGTLAVERDRGHRVRFVAGVPGRYEDVMIFRRDAERALRARLAHGRA